MFRPLLLAKHETAVYFASAHARSASQALLGEPPHSGGESHGGIQNAVEFPCGNSTPCPRLRRGRIQFGTKFNWVEVIRQSQNPLSKQSDRSDFARAACVVNSIRRVRSARADKRLGARRSARQTQKNFLAFSAWLLPRPLRRKAKSGKEIFGLLRRSIMDYKPSSK